MPIRFPCTACGQLLGIATRKVGTEIHCPTCGLAVIVPDEEQAKLLRQRAREPKNHFASPDTPPEISIPRERDEAFDGGLESFLTQLDVAPVAPKPAAATVTTKSAAPPPAKPAPPKSQPAATVTPKPAAATAPVKASNGTHALPTPSSRPAAPPAGKPPVAAAVAPSKQPPPAAAEEIPFAFEDQEVSVLSAADLLEVADEFPPTPAPPPSAKAPALPKPSLPAVKPTVAPPAKPAPAPAVSKPAAAPPLAPLAVPAPVVVPEAVPLVESIQPALSDFGFDFSSPPSPTVATRKAAPVTAPAATASPSPAAIPTAPFENAVWISRRAIYTHVAILVLVSVVTFLVGWISGGAGARTPGGSNAGPVRFEAQIQYMANGKTLPDEGAVVLLWPKQAKPLERLSSKRLTPLEPAPPADFPTLKAIETLHGAYTRTNAQGEVRDLLLTEPGEFYVLVISRNMARPPMEQLNDKAIPILGDLFGGEAVTLLGNRQFTLKSYMIADTRTLNHTFGAPVEK